MVLVLILFSIFLPLCVSAPINYDTAQIPDGRATLRIGAGMQRFKGRYYGCGSHTYTGGTVRGDVQVGYGIRRIAEVGVQGGVAAGEYRMSDETDSVSSSGTFLQIDAYPYLKVGIPGERFRTTLKVAAGGGLTTLRGGGFYGVEGIGWYPMAYADLLFGLGTPERLTFGLRVSPVEGLSALGSLHLGPYVLSVMAGGNPRTDWNHYTLHVGFGLVR